jgi:hypothetical protein
VRLARGEGVMAESTADRVIIFDTTLRDGEQAPGFSMNVVEKLEMAQRNHPNVG